MGCFESSPKEVLVIPLQTKISRPLIVQCKICLEQYNLTTKTPCSLPCFHTICLECVNGLSKKECPFDHKPFKEHGKNYQLINVLEEYRGKKMRKEEDLSLIKQPTTQQDKAKGIKGPPKQDSTPLRFEEIRIDLAPVRPPKRIFNPQVPGDFSPNRMPNLNVNSCGSSHKYTLLSYEAKCNKCNTNGKCSQCSICRHKECIRCHKVDFKSDKCPANHPTKWRNSMNKCIQCTNIRPGKACIPCNYSICDDCCKAHFTKTCPNRHETKWVSYKDRCLKCKSFSRGFHCVTCMYHFCQDCAKIRFDPVKCPNNHDTVSRSIRSTCTKCHSIETGKSCTRCLYHICKGCIASGM